jgi:hypothetical protein
MLRNSASGPEIGLPGRILAGLLPGRHRLGTYDLFIGMRTEGEYVEVGERVHYPWLWDTRSPSRCFLELFTSLCFTRNSYHFYCLSRSARYVQIRTLLLEKCGSMLIAMQNTNP